MEAVVAGHVQREFQVPIQLQLKGLFCHCGAIYRPYTETKGAVLAQEGPAPQQLWRICSEGDPDSQAGGVHEGEDSCREEASWQL